MKLSNSDLQRILSSLNRLTSDHTPEILPERTISSINSLFSTDVIAFEGFGIDNFYQGPLWYVPVESVSNQMLVAMNEYVSDHPCFDGTGARHLKQTVRISDYMTLPDFKRTTIYNEFFRYLGTDRQLVGGLHISPELTITCSLCRLQKDFTERDCQIFDLLNPHLVSAFRNAQLINRLKFESEQLQIAVETTKYGVITIDKDSQTQIESPTAAKFLMKYFPGESTTLPEELNRFIKYHRSIFNKNEFYLPPVPLKKACRNGKLIIRLTFHSSTKTTVLLFEEISDFSPANFADLKITNRETEILFWISQGKTDGEIGRLLNISIRTVQKHVENIFNKLGVETRTAAVSMAMKKRLKKYFESRSDLTD